MPPTYITLSLAQICSVESKIESLGLRMMHLFLEADGKQRLRCGMLHHSDSPPSRLISALLPTCRYYRLFARAYSYSLSQADRVVVNGTWTKNHIDGLLARHNQNGKKERFSTSAGGVKVVFPPCETEALEALDISEYRERIVISVAQFR